MTKKRIYVLVKCRDCDKAFPKRNDGLKKWSGLCKSCSHMQTTTENFWEMVSQPTEGCWLWTKTILANGYGQVMFKGQRWQAHKLSYTLTYGPIPVGKIVMHTCDVRACCRPDHLVLGTNKDNTQDMIRKKRTSHGNKHWYHRFPEKIIRGENHGQAKLNDAAIVEIRALWGKGKISQSEIARRYGVSHTQINRIIHSKSRKQIA